MNGVFKALHAGGPGRNRLINFLSSLVAFMKNFILKKILTYNLLEITTNKLVE